MTELEKQQEEIRNGLEPGTAARLMAETANTVAWQTFRYIVTKIEEYRKEENPAPGGE